MSFIKFAKWIGIFYILLIVVSVLALTSLGISFACFDFIETGHFTNPYSIIIQTGWILLLPVIFCLAILLPILYIFNLVLLLFDIISYFKKKDFKIQSLLYNFESKILNNKKNLDLILNIIGLLTYIIVTTQLLNFLINE